MYKLIVLDIDGTLRDERYGIPVSAKEAIETCYQKGYQICICTGRNLASIQDDVWQLPVDYWIMGGGHLITTPAQIVSEHYFDQEDIVRVYDYLQAHQEIGAVLEGKTEMFMNQKAVDQLTTMNQQKHLYPQNHKIEYKNNFKHYQHQSIHKLCLWCQKDKYVHIQSLIQLGYVIAQQTNQYYELVCPMGDKGTAIQKLIQYLNINKDEVIAFGDGLNDMSLFENVGCSIAMGNANNLLKQYATHVCENIMDDGLYKELKRQKMI